MDTLFGDLEPEVNPGWEYMLKLLADKDIAKYICDAKGFYHSDIQLAGNIWDVSLMGYLLNPASNKYTMPELMHSYDAGVQEPEEAWTDSMKLGWLAVLWTGSDRGKTTEKADAF